MKDYLGKQAKFLNETEKNLFDECIHVFEGLLDKIQGETREQVDRLIDHLIANSNYFIAPAAPGKYHNSFKFGLLDHSINVAIMALKFNEILQVTNESDVIIAALFHDLGKAMKAPGIYYYEENVPTDRQKQYGFVCDKPYKYNSDPAVYLTVPQRAVRELTLFVDISDAVYQAILVHDGQYVPENEAYGGNENPLGLLLHYADSWSGFITECVVNKAPDSKSYIISKQDKVGLTGNMVRKRVI